MNTDFNKLSIEKQIEFINNELKKDSNISVTKLCKKYGLKKNTIVSRFTKLGYKYNSDIRQYIKSNQVIQNNNKSINNNKIEVSKNNNSKELQEFKELKTTLAEVKELLDMKEELKEVIQHYNKSKNIIDVPEQVELRIDKDKFNGELKGRLIKVYDNINNDWIKFCKKNNQFKMQDLYSMALLEYMEKYKK